MLSVSDIYIFFVYDIYIYIYLYIYGIRGKPSDDIWAQKGGEVEREGLFTGKK